MRRLAFLFLVFDLAVAGCAGPTTGRYGASGQGGASQADRLDGDGLGQSSLSHTGQQVAILLPLTGPRSELGRVLLQAAQLAIGESASVPLDILDTGGTAAGASAAASAAVAHGDAIILGPLTSAETAAVAQVAPGAGIPVLAFTNDSSLSQPGVWPLGIAPVQQINRLVGAASARGKSHFAALLPDTDYGRAMGSALRAAVGANGFSEPDLKTHSPSMASITSAARELSGYESRRGQIDRKVKALLALRTADARREAQELSRTPIQPPPFDVLLLADTGDDLQEIAAVLPYFDVDRSAVQIVGPALWGDVSSGSAAVAGAWYAAPDSDARASFNAAHLAQFGTPAPPLADLAFDGASIAKSVVSSTVPSLTMLTRPDGFAGSDGWIKLLPTGEVVRGLAVYVVSPSGRTLLEPAPGPGL